MQFTIVSVLALATGILAAPQWTSTTSVDSGSCREYTYCITPTTNTGLLNIFGTNQDDCDTIGGDQYCCNQNFTVGGFLTQSELNNACGLNLSK